MAEVSLDGLRVELAHSLAHDEANRRIERAARDLAEGSLSRQRARVETVEPGRIHLSGGKEGTHFKAHIFVGSRNVTVDLTGALSLSFIEITLGGGSDGVRRRVLAEVERALRERLAA